MSPTHTAYFFFTNRSPSDIILACLRLTSLSNLATTTDVSWELQPIGMWTNLEVSVAIICASLPALRPLITKLFPGYFSSMSNPSYQLRSCDHQNDRIESSRSKVLSNLNRISNPGRLRLGVGNIESGDLGLQTTLTDESARSREKDEGIQVDYFRSIHAYTCETKEEGGRFAGRV